MSVLQIPRRGLMGSAGGGELPQGFAKISYLSNPNGAYIDTGTPLANGCKITVAFNADNLTNPHDDRFVYGWRRSGNYSGNDHIGIGQHGSATYVFAGTSTLAHMDEWSTLADTTIVFDAITGVMTVNGTNLSCNYTNGAAFDLNGSSVYNPFLFAFNDRGNAVSIHNKVKLFRYSVERNGAYEQYMIPCIDPNGVYGLYDTARKVFLASANAKTFSGG